MKSGTRTKGRSCYGKNHYRTAKYAWSRIYRLAEQGAFLERLDVYPCDGGFHIGHVGRKEYERRYNIRRG